MQGALKNVYDTLPGQKFHVIFQKNGRTDIVAEQSRKTLRVKNAKIKSESPAKVFLHVRNKKRHVDTAHLKIRHRCPFCPKQYTARKKGVAHLVQHHEMTRDEAMAQNILRILPDGEEIPQVEKTAKPESSKPEVSPQIYSKR